MLELPRLIRKLSCFFLLCFLGNALFGAPFGSPAFPDLIEKSLFIPADTSIHVRAGYEGDFVFYLPLKQEEGGGSIDKYTQVVNAGTVTLNLFKSLDLFSSLGSSQICSHWRFTSSQEEIFNVQTETPHCFLWAVGGRLVLYKHKKWNLGMMGRYSSSDGSLRWATIDGESVSSQGSQLHFHEWQLGVATSYKIDLFTPYLGVNCLFAQTKIALPSLKNEFKSKVPVGVYLGCTLTTQKYFMLNLEARLISEEAVSVSGDFSF